MSKVAIATDSNSSITQERGKELGIFVLPMPFYIDGNLYMEGVDLSPEKFYEKQNADAEISTSQPAVAEVTDFWDQILEEYDEIVYIPMSSGLSGSCQTAIMLSEDYDGKVQVVNNQRISVTLALSLFEAKELASQGKSAKEIREILEEHRFDSSIYITLKTLKYLKKGGRITPAAAAVGTILKIKPVLQIQGEKLDAFSKCRGMSQAKEIMYEAIKKDCIERFHAVEEGLKDMILMLAYTGNEGEVEEYRKEAMAMFPGKKFLEAPLSLSIACHIGEGALGIACAKKLPGVDYSKYGLV